MHSTWFGDLTCTVNEQYSLAGSGTYCVSWEFVTDMLLKLFRLLVTNYQESGDLASLGQGCQRSEWLKCCHLQGYSIPRILWLFDQWRRRHHVHSEHREPFNPWHSTTPPVPINTAARTWDNGVTSQKTFNSSDVQILTFAETPVSFSQRAWAAITTSYWHQSSIGKTPRNDC
jgi:hypothetical protein